MGRVRLWPLGLTVLALLVISGCSEKENNPFDPAQDRDPPVVTSFSYANGVATWTTNEPALCILEYGPGGGEEYYHYVYESDKEHASDHSATLLGMEAGEEYTLRIRSIDRAGNEAYEATAAMPRLVDGTSFGGLTMTLSMIDVGWGLAMVLTTPDGSHVMIDAGQVSKLDDVLTFLQDHGIDIFDAAVVTHHHSDHYGGYVGDDDELDFVPGIMDLYAIGVVILPDPAYLLDGIRPALQDKIDLYNFPVAFVRQGDSNGSLDALRWDATPGFSVQVLSAGVGTQLIPPAEVGSLELSGNNDSVVVRFNFGDVSFITMADGEFFVEHYIVDYYGRYATEAHVLQVGHHANDDATSTFWLDNVRPRVGLISNAMAEAPLEKEIVLNAILRYQADYFVTDRIFPNTSRNADPIYGNLLAETDGETIEIILEPHDW